MKKSGKTSNKVRTMNRLHTFVLGSLFVEKNGYSTTRQEMFRAIRKVYGVLNSPCSDVTVYLNLTCKIDYTATKNSTGGLSIGCMQFSRPATRKIAIWAGIQPKNIRRYGL